ncbi:complement C3-like isoform X1 [Brienomyrus brachyistius]|uniref:complement C3-like isoform X1 n=1 Tax=Brienomyrus brachyistius TaxID=42636 RepID=UPI0020B1924B|nr:complement C3-like isoform X1 [Brienomyrus brachyistius]
MRAAMDLLWLVSFTLMLPALYQCDPLYIMSAPNLLRVGSKEKVFVEAQEYIGGNIEVEISVKDFPAKNREFFHKKVTLTSHNKFLLLQEIEIKEDAFDRTSTKKQYVYLQAKFPQHQLEKVVLLSFQDGYIFVQTDKTIYTPTSTVHYRIFTLNPSMEPADKSVFVEIMNPEGITIHRSEAFSGTKSEIFYLPEVISTGTWKVVGKFQKSPQINFTAEFEVKEYVLPTFEVSLKAEQPFFYVEDEDLQIGITAKYLYGKEVNGKAFVVFGLMTPEGEKKSLPGSLQRVEIIEGKGKATLKTEHILQVSPNMEQLVGSSIYVSVSVLTNTGTEMVEAEKKGILIVTSPYSIHFQKTPQYFKPGMPFDIIVYVTNPDESPAENIRLKVSPGNVYGDTNKEGLAKLTINTGGGANDLKVTVETVLEELQPQQQARKTMVAQPYRTYQNSQNYLHIGITSAELVIGDNLLVNLNLKNNPGVQDQISHFTYLVVNKGQIVHADRQERQKGQSLVTLSLPIRKDMIPSFRLVVYYHLGAAEVVSDSVWVDVKDTCMGTLKITSKKTQYPPRSKFTLNIEGDPEAKVGLVAVDKGVYVLNSRNRLTQSKIWDTVEKHDIGCTAGSGRNSMDVFYDAGLIFQSNANVETKSRTEPHCPAPSKRRRRSITLLDLKSSLVGKYSTELQKQGCADGMVESLMEYTCERRAEFIIDGAECVSAFLHCCNAAATNRQKAANENLGLARSDDDESYTPDRDIVSRTQFPESWLWQEETLPACPRGRPDCASTSMDITNFLKDSITTWEVTAVSLSKKSGICMASPFEMKVMKDFFIDLKLPYSAVRNEQLEIKAVLYNYMENDIRVRVELMETETVCSAAHKKRKYRQEVDVDAMSSYAVPFVVIPMGLGEHSIEVKASVYDSTFSDGVKKNLLVVPEGIHIRKEIKTVILNPATHNGNQMETVKGADLKNRVPGSPADTFISVTGEQIGQTIYQVISGSPLGNLIQQPSGCGEQNMIGLTGPVIATRYLDSTGEWEKVGVDKRETAIKYIRTGYIQELTFRKDDGSYSVWKHTPSSTWLTAYVTKVFAMAYRLISIEENVICSGTKWLILNAQEPDGTFKEHAPVYHGEMVGNVRGKDADASLTAFVLIALQEARPICGADKVGSLPDSIKKAQDFLTGRIRTLTNPYAVAMTSYALANEGKHQVDTLMKFASRDKTHWPVIGSHLFTLEATAYALLALVRAKEFDKAGPVVEWLTKQQFYGGGHGSTQATIMVFQAVAQYYTDVTELKDINLQVDISVAGRSKPLAWTFNKGNAYLTRSLKVNYNQDLNITAKGTGQGVVSVMTMYNALPAEEKVACKNFDLKVKLTKTATKQDYLESYKLEIDMTYLSTERDATMTVLDITLLTGFVADQDDLRRLTTGKDRYVQRFEMDKQLSQKGSLILYMDKVSRKVPDRVVFKLHKEQKVGILQPAGITVYEYYSMENRCTQFYHPEKMNGSLNRICHEDVCRCAEENCSLQKKLGKDDLDRYTEACHAGVDYVYKAMVQDAVLSHTLDHFILQIVEVIKEGTDTGVQGQRRQFISHPYCRDAIDLQVGKTYLLMGKSDDLMKGDKDSLYMLGGGTWIEYWPTNEDCQKEEYRQTCLSITTSTTDLLTFGCPT